MSINNQEHFYSWIDEEIESYFSNYQKYLFYGNIINRYERNTTKELVIWYMNLLKKEGLDNSEIHLAMNEIFQSIDGIQPTEKSICNSDKATRWCGYDVEQLSWNKFLTQMNMDWCKRSFSNLKTKFKTPLLRDLIQPEVIEWTEGLLKHGCLDNQRIFSKKYQYVDENSSLTTWNLLNLIVEEDRTKEEMFIRAYLPKDEYLPFLKNYEIFEKFMCDVLQGYVVNGFENVFSEIVKAILSADPTEISSKNENNEKLKEKIQDNKNTPLLNFAKDTNNHIIQEWYKYKEELNKKYTAKSQWRWRNIQYYDPLEFSLEKQFEYYKKIDEVGENHQQLKLPAKSCYFTRQNDYLIALFNAIQKILLTVTTRESNEFKLGNSFINFHTNLPDNDYSNDLKENDYLEVIAKKEDLILVLNTYDYLDLKMGVERTYFGLFKLEHCVGAIHSTGWIAPGRARLINRNAFRVYPRLKYASPWQNINYNLNFEVVGSFNICMFQNLVGCLIAPKPI